MSYPITKKCEICGNDFIIQDFSQAKRKYCYTCSPKDRKGDWTPVFKAIKHQLILEKGGKCEICGYNKCEAALNFHHINPDEKEFDLSMKSKNKKINIDECRKEAEKCQLLCANCHMELHYMN